MTYGRIETVAELPPAGPLSHRAREKVDLDFKVFADKGKMSEHAKDIAAFANALGGVLLLGADDSTGILRYTGLRGQNAKDVQAIYEAAARLCSPSPIVDVVPIVEKNVVAVNVEPFIDQLIASPAKLKDQDGTTAIQKHAWLFPLRRASQTAFIEPENFAMYMNRDVRRAVLLLAKIPMERRKTVTISHHTSPRQSNPMHPVGPFEVSQLKLAVEEISVERNFVAFVKVSGATSHRCHAPLTDVLDIWETETGDWHILVRGGLVEATKSKERPSLDYVVHSRL